MKNPVSDGRFSDLLRDAGLKSTRCRTAVLGILSDSEVPLAAEEVFLCLKKRGVSVNLSTVYRSLELLAEHNLLTKLTLSAASRAFFEFRGDRHRHWLVCMGCRKFTAVEHCPLEAYERALADQTGYVITGHKLAVYGYCPVCEERFSEMPLSQQRRP